MTAFKIEKVGLVAHYSKQGDWAFNVAFDFARRKNLQLNVFYFLNSSFDMPQDKAPTEIEAPDVPDEVMIAEDRTLREELPGYREYAARTGHRLLPGIW